MASLLAACLLLLGAERNAAVLHVKVIEIEPESKRVTVLLPMHQTELATRAEEPRALEVLKENDFYRARVIPGKLKTTKRSRLRVFSPERGKVELTIYRITFLGGR